MNRYLDGQIQSVIIMVKTFRTSCEMAAMKNDGKIDRNEAKALKRINAACDRFIKEIQKANK